jgi:hypothetical protein
MNIKSEQLCWMDQTEYFPRKDADRNPFNETLCFK